MTSVNTVPQYSTLAAIVHFEPLLSFGFDKLASDIVLGPPTIGSGTLPLCTDRPLLTDRAVQSSSVVDADGGQLRARDDRGRVQRSCRVGQRSFCRIRCCNLSSAARFGCYTLEDDSLTPDNRGL
jgi:hypothetical protein